MMLLHLSQLHPPNYPSISNHQLVSASLPSLTSASANVGVWMQLPRYDLSVSADDCSPSSPPSPPNPLFPYFAPPSSPLFLIFLLFFLLLLLFLLFSSSYFCFSSFPSLIPSSPSPLFLLFFSYSLLSSFFSTIFTFSSSFLLLFFL